MIGIVGGPVSGIMVSCVLPDAVRALETDHLEDCELFCLRREPHSRATQRTPEIEEEEQP
jgi:hypothetical protein